MPAYNQRRRYDTIAPQASKQRPADADLRVAVSMASQAMRPIAELLSSGGEDSRDLARRAALAGGRAAFFARRGFAPTVAARLAVRGVFPEVAESEWLGELDEEFRRSMVVKLSWSAKSMTAAEIASKRPQLRGGVYIRVNSFGRPLKVGKTIDFYDRPADYPPNSRFWIATIQTDESDPVGIVEAVEHVVARTLMRLGYALPQHRIPRATVETRHQLIVRNLLPRPFVGDVSRAYPRTATTTHRGKSDEPGKVATAPTNRPDAGALILRRGMAWEMGTPVAE